MYDGGAGTRRKGQGRMRKRLKGEGKVSLGPEDSLLQLTKNNSAGAESYFAFGTAARYLGPFADRADTDQVRRR